MDSVLYHQSKILFPVGKSRHFHLVKLDSRPNRPNKLYSKLDSKSNKFYIRF